MAVLYQVPVFHAVGDLTAGAPVKLAEDFLNSKKGSLVKSLKDPVNQYWERLIPLFLEQLREDGLMNRKKKFTTPVHLFLDGLYRPGRELLQKIFEVRAHRESPMYELTTRLCTAGATLHKTELCCLLGKTPVSFEHGERITILRDTYIAGRMRRVLTRQPEATGILIIGAGHGRVALPAPIEVKVFHRGDMWPRRFIEWLDPNLKLPMCCPDDFGHIPGYT